MSEALLIALIGAAATLGAALIDWFAKRTTAAAPSESRVSSGADSLVAPVASNEGIFWQHDAGRYADLLVVLVHGLNGDPSRTWDDLPRHLQTHLQTKLKSQGHADVFSFAYAAGMFQSAA
jgi:hypothetical protein